MDLEKNINFLYVTKACPANAANGTCLSTGEQVLDLYGYSVDNWMMDLLGLTSIYIVFHFLAYNSVLIRSRKS